MNDQPTIIKQPLVIMFNDDNDKIICHLYPRKEDTYEHYGLLICDLIRHTAKCFKVDEDKIFEWIEKERLNPTTPIEQAN